MTKLIHFAKRNQVIFSSYGIAIFLLIVVGIFRHGFLESANLKNLAINAAVVGLVALGQTFVILIGGIDLSIPWTLNSVAVLLTMIGTGSSIALSIPLLLVGAAAVGVINGLAIAYLELSPVIVTLGMNSILQGSLLAYTKGQPGGGSPNFIQYISQGSIFNIPIILLIWIVIIVISLLLLSYTPLGRRIYATGNSPMTSYFSGLNTRHIQVIVYGISGFAAGLAGIILTGRVGQAYLGMGDSYLFESVAAVAIGGASILGGSGHYIGTVSGAFILTILASMLPVFNLPASAQQILYGLVVLLAVIIARNKEQER